MVLTRHHFVLSKSATSYHSTSRWQSFAKHSLSKRDERGWDKWICTWFMNQYLFLESDLPFHHSSSIWLKWHVIISLTCNHLRILRNDCMYFYFVFIHPISWYKFYILVYTCISTKAQWVHFVGKKILLSFAFIRKKK